MKNPADYPAAEFIVLFLVLWLSSRFGATVLKKKFQQERDVRDDLMVVLTTTLTMLGLIIGFTFSMAISRYDQRKNYEANEANAIGTEYVRLDLLPAADKEKIKPLLRQYLDERILFYNASRDQDQIAQINARTIALQNEMWRHVQEVAALHPTPIVGLAASGMNDVLNTQAYTQAAWWNRIPTEARILIVLLSVCCNVMLGYSIRNPKMEKILILIMPLFISVAFFLIMDIDSVRGGLITISPDNLISLSQQLEKS